MKILLTEDNIELQNSIVQYLKNEGIVCECANSISQCKEKLSAFQYDIVILDRMLPDGDGIELISYIKEQKVIAGIMIASAKDKLDDKVDGLNLGADDYITKPFFMTELVARLNALYRRKNFSGNHTIKAGNIEIDTAKMQVSANSSFVPLTRKEYDLLVYFFANQNRILTKVAIAEHLWGDYTDALGSLDFVYQHIKNLRKKIMAKGGNDFIETVYGTGYRFLIKEL
ncbi:MAG: response regulator transcription factor [Reichenbachiella sp.]